MGFFNEAKSSYEKFRKNRSEEWNKRQAEKLGALRTRREKEEGKAKLLKLEAKERSRIDKAKAYAREQRGLRFKAAKDSISKTLKSVRKELRGSKERRNEAFSLKSEDVYKLK